MKRVIIDDEHYVSISLILHRYVIFVIMTVTAVAAGVLSRLSEALGDYQVLRARHKGPGISRCFAKCTFSTCYRTRRSAVKVRPPAMRSVFRFFRKRSQARGNIRRENF